MAAIARAHMHMQACAVERTSARSSSQSMWLSPDLSMRLKARRKFSSSCAFLNSSFSFSRRSFSCTDVRCAHKRSLNSKQFGASQDSVARGKRANGAWMGARRTSLLSCAAFLSDIWPECQWPRTASGRVHRLQGQRCPSTDSQLNSAADRCTSCRERRASKRASCTISKPLSHTLYAREFDLRVAYATSSYIVRVDLAGVRAHLYDVYEWHSRFDSRQPHKTRIQEEF